MLAENGALLRVFISENNHHEGKPLYEWIAKTAREQGLAGVTVVRGMEGFGSHKELHSSKFLDLASSLPIMIYVVDTMEKVENFAAQLDSVVREGLVTLEPLHMRVYGSKQN